MRNTLAIRYSAAQPVMAENIIGHYERASIDIRQAGLVWYPRAVYGCQTWARELDYSPATVACIVAALSPQTDWQSNLRNALSVLVGTIPEGNGVLGANVRKAFHIRRTRAESLVGLFKHGPKVNAFALNLQGDSNAVTVDTHAAQAAMDDVTLVGGHVSRHYDAFAQPYRLAAKHLGLRPCDLQAIVWLQWKHENPPATKRYLRRTE